MNLNFIHAIHPESVGTNLYTDADGCIDLGPLTDIVQVSTNFNSAYGSCGRTWNIPYLKEMVDYPTSMDVLEDEPIEIPVPCSELSHADLSLIKYSHDGSSIDNRYANFSMDMKSGHGFGNLILSSLDKGSYKLNIKKLNITMTITVHDGVYWEAEGFVLKKTSIMAVRRETRFLRIHNINITAAEESKGEEDVHSKLQFKLNFTNSSTRAHVFAFNYMPTQPFDEYRSMVRMTKNKTDVELFPFTKWDNVYQSNRKLGDEYRYVFNRKNAKRFIGNTLERPQLIMKRLKVRDTTFDSEVVRDGAAYDAIHAQKEYNLRSAAFKREAYYDRGYGGANQNNLERIQCQQNYINGFQNFLKHATYVQKNLHPNDDGVVECDFDAEHYTNILIVATSNKSTTQVMYDIENPIKDTEKRNLSLTDPLDHNKYYNEVRNTDKVLEGKTYNIQDITSTEYIFVDSINKIKKVSDDL